MGLADSDNVLDDIFLPSSTKTEQNVGKFAPKPGSKLKKPFSKNTKPYNTSSSIEENPGQVLSGVIPEPVSVMQPGKFQPKSAFGSKGSKNKSVSFSLLNETEKSPSHEKGLESLDLNTTLELDGGDLFNREDSSVKIANEHAEFLEIVEEFEPIDDIMDIDSWDEPSIPTKLGIDGADKSKTLGGMIKRNSTRRTFENDNYINDDSGDIGDLNKSDNDNNEGVNWAPNDTIDTKKTSKRKKKSFEESDSRKALEPKKSIPHGTRRKRQVDKTLLNKSEHEIDLTQLPIRELILLAEAKERNLSKEAAISLSNSNNDSNADHDNPLDEGFEPDSEEAHRHWLKHAKKVNYHTHMNMSRSRIWSKEETVLFYEAIRDFKTNFGMMACLFPGRTPRQLKAKFKAEERRHPLELRDALDFRSKDHTLFDKVIQAMKEQKEAEDAAANTEEEIGQCEKESAATESNHKADNSENDPWNDGDFDFNESADLELDVNVSSTPNKDEKADTEKEKAENNFGDEVNNSEEKNLWDEDFELFDEDLESETGAVTSQFDEKLDEK